jgi:hypothetical protein
VRKISCFVLIDSTCISFISCLPKKTGGSFFLTKTDELKTFINSMNTAKKGKLTLDEEGSDLIVNLPFFAVFILLINVFNSSVFVRKISCFVLIDSTSIKTKQDIFLTKTDELKTFINSMNTAKKGKLTLDLESNPHITIY